MDLETVADELYSLSRQEFTDARKAAARRAREQGRRNLAEQIGALRRPSTAAWLANQFARDRPEQVQTLMQLGDELRAAQRQLQGEQLRWLSQQRHEMVHNAVQQVRELACTASYQLSDAVTRELVNTFTAAVNSSAAARTLAAGRLTAALDPADAAADLFAGASVGDRSRANSDGAAGSGNEQDGPLCRDLERLRTEASGAETARGEAQRTLTDADHAVADAAAAVRDMRARLEAAEQAEQEARHRAQSAQRDVEAAERAVREAQQRVRDLEHQLAQHNSR